MSMTKKKCPFCQTEIYDDGGFCPTCGKAVTNTEEIKNISCQFCGKILNEDDKFCSSCGKSRNEKYDSSEEKREVGDETITFLSSAENSPDKPSDLISEISKSADKAISYKDLNKDSELIINKERLEISPSPNEKSLPDNSYIVKENIDIAVITKDKKEKSPAKKEKGWSVLISFLLSILLILTAVTNIVQGTAYNFYTSLSIGKLFSAFLDYNEYDLYANLPRNLSSYAKGEDELVKFLNSRLVKRGVQETINSYILTLATGEPLNLITENRLADIVRGLKGDIEEMSGHTLTEENVTEIAAIIHSDLKYNLVYSVNPNFVAEGEISLLQIRNNLEILWINAPIEAVLLRILLLPITNYILTGLSALLLIILIIINRKTLYRLPLLLGVPLFIVSAILLGLSGFIFFLPNIVLNYFAFPSRITSALMGSFVNTTLILTAVSIALSVIVIVIKRNQGNAREHSNYSVAMGNVPPAAAD